MLDEIESIRMTTERLVLSLKENLSQEELSQEKLEAAVNKLEIIMERMRLNCDTNSGDSMLNDFQFEESKRLFDQISRLLTELTAVHERNKKLGGIYYVDDSSIPNCKNISKNEIEEGSAKK